MHCKRRGSEKSTFLAIFWGFLISQDCLFSRNSTRKPLNVIKSPIFTSAPCKTARLYNAPSMHTVANGPFGTPFLTPKIPPKKFMWVPFSRSFPGNEANKPFSGGPQLGVSGGGQKVYVEKIYVLFPSLIGVRFLSSSSGKSCALPLKVPNHTQYCIKIMQPSWHGSRNFIQYWGWVWGNDPMAFPGSSSALDKFRGPTTHPKS